MRRALRALAMLGSMVACASGSRSESAYVAQLPADVRESYGVFAHRCSKCHSLARPLDSGIDDDAYWAMYVDRMRRQPASGITLEDRAQILTFLGYYASEQRARRARTSTPARASTPPDAGEEEAK
jgi:hypothetical protein